MTYGIDVAKWQGTIDWGKVNADGKDFAILKVTQKNNSIEGSFENNYTNARKNGIRVIGVYRYVYATTKAAAIKEAQAIVSILKGRVITGGVWLDMEDSSIKNLGKTKLTEIIMAEAFILRAAGYPVGIYCSYDWFKNVLESNYLCSQMFPFWIARYGSNNGTVIEKYNPQSLNKERVMAWQYSSKGKVNGVSGDCDVDLCYYRLDEVMNLYKLATAQL